MGSKLKPLIKLFYSPVEAMAEIGAGAPYLTGALLALLSTVIYRELLGHEIIGAFERSSARPSAPGLMSPIKPLVPSILAAASPIFFLLVVFIPACLLASSLIEKRASFSVLLRQEYAPVASCALYAWAAAHLVMIVPALVIYRPGDPNQRALVEALRLVPLPYFVFLITIGLRSTLRVAYGRAVAVVAFASISLIALPFLTGVLLPLLTSPFLLIMVILLLRNLLGDAMSAQRAREDFKRNLEAATLNPADASAHYNLGLIYQQRGQYEEAKASFARAIEIDPDETDAHYQLGRIVREQGRLAEAVGYFDAVVSRNPDHSQSEVWREIGRAYYEAGQNADALAAFERFLDKRPSDAEGHYRYGLTLHRLGREEEAKEQMRSCIESARTSPAYKYRVEKRWMSEAQSFLRSQEALGSKQ